MMVTMLPGQNLLATIAGIGAYAPLICCALREEGGEVAPLLAADPYGNQGTRNPTGATFVPAGPPSTV